MFCPKCGAQLSDDAKFCPTCGTTIDSQPAAPKDAPTGTATTKKVFRLPGAADAIPMALAICLFLFSFIPTICLDLAALYMGGMPRLTFSVLSKDMFSLSGWLGMGKVFAIMGIVLFFFYLATFFLDVENLLGNAGKTIRRLLPLIYYVPVLLALLFTFLGAVITDGCGLAYAWFLSFFLCVVGAVVSVIPDLLAKLFAGKK